MIGHYLMFARNCEAALRTYEAAFGARIQQVQRYGDMPPNPDFPIAEADRNLVLNARFTIREYEIMCADSARPYQAGNNMYVSVMMEEASIRQAWEVLKEDGEIYMELAPAFFATLHGSLRDRYGINWMFSAPK